MTRRSPIGKGFDYRAFAKEKAEKHAQEERERLEARAYQQYERELAAKENPKDPGWAGLDKDAAKYRSRELALADANSAERAAAAKYAARVADAFDLTPETERIFALLCAATEIPKKPQMPGWADFQPASIPAWLILDLPEWKPGVVRHGLMQWSQPAPMLSNTLQAEAARRMQAAVEELENCGLIKWLAPKSFGRLHIGWKVPEATSGSGA
jgi:hypothetical protein